MIKTSLKKIFGLKPPGKSPYEMLLEKAHEMPRFKPVHFSFNDISLHVPDMLSVVYQLEEFFIHEKFNFISNEQRPVIYDCGANVGVASIYFHLKFPDSLISSFEPDPAIIPYLKENLAANGIKNVRILEVAVWTNSDGLIFGSEGADGGSIYFPQNKIKVRSVRLKDELAKETSVTLLKVDIEGAELEVIRDCESELHKVSYLFVEYHSWKNRNQELSELLNVLERNGFRYYIDNCATRKHPFVENNPASGMDVQLNIYAVNRNA
jgi:FkbM family methyltransferase